ncbi:MULTISPECIES: hypothetical protein [unclassified Solwaraspora]|uniref:hypothetical protein n=1 Tax=unclassified Solwaraspora TaxID=2627926 RepID=UPI00248AA913|nr:MULTISPECIES: hypothetical protein [unclassified Solwaraspora]WBB96164.1 hypothetical protein O7553_22895 [Solwaraspora sp. WMMA2059]WBC19932.1 hypothetical protein O7543_24480 [Solwaraspora sp. WMMA2080]WJK32475.1 hypothetical protein O7610_17045 [Solwaraspora sp. WMMA2065]
MIIADAADGHPPDFAQHPHGRRTLRLLGAYAPTSLRAATAALPVRTFYALYAGVVVAREYGWTEAGKISAARHGVSERETVEALYSPQRIENHIGTLLLAVAGLADTARVIMVLCERVGKVNSYAILAARPATPEEVKQWMEGTR